ncbi:MAG: polysaccharide deacetylase family protein [Polyangiaceae bacterium]|nr:polysaccharide deacetylase family protein [Polyangiaceae bacterium]
MVRPLLAAVSVDLDEIPAYHAIHGLPPPDTRAQGLVYDMALARLEDLAQAHGVPLTLFVVGADLARPGNAERLRRLAARGHALENHSLDHRYDLVRLGRSEIRRQIASGITVLEGATGVRPTGFRAPGYTITDEVLTLLREHEVRWDSSVFPCPVYWGAKAAAMGLQRLGGRRSRSILDTPRVLSAPVRPYRVGRPYHRTGHGLLELPIQVTRRLRLPFIGTALTLAGPRGAVRLAEGVVGEPFVNLELHGIDLLDAGDGLGALAPHQPDVRVPWRRKREALAAALERLSAGGHAFCRLDEVAARYA